MKKINILSQATLALSAGLLLNACSSMRHEKEPAYSSTSYRTSDTEYSADTATTQKSRISESSGAQSDGRTVNEIDIPLHEERVNVGKRTVDAGQVTIRKVVTTETVNQPVQLRRETLVIDRDGGNNQQSSLSSSQSSQNSINQSQPSGSTASQTEYQSSSRSSSSRDWQPSATTEEQSAGYLANKQVGSPRALEQSEDRRAAITTEPAGAARESTEQNQSAYSESTTRSTSGQKSSSNWTPSSSGVSQSQSGTAFQEQSFTIRLQEEQPVIEKNVVQTGRVTARKNSKMQQQNVSQQIRREEVQLDRSGAQNIEIQGNFQNAGKPLTEPSGAQPQQKSPRALEQQSDKSNQSESDQQSGQNPSSQNDPK